MMPARIGVIARRGRDPRAAPAPSVRRARPLLGTLVDLRIDGWSVAQAQPLLERAFAEVAAIHRLMSFHRRDSDLARLHRARPGRVVRVDARTHCVLDWAMRIAADSHGRFDPTVAAQQVAWGLLPRPARSCRPDPRANWGDIELVGARGVRLLRPLWIDLGGIAKGFAVDRALAILMDAGVPQACVNAGGDLRIAGPAAEIVYLRAAPEPLPLLELANGAVATSVTAHGARDGRTAHGRHVDGTTRAAVASRGESVSVAASTCLLADALTKVVLARRDALTRHVLDRYGAQSRTLAASAIGAGA